ncbi:ABC transporter substrate-binding protein [Microvirga zambiensis]|uniref:ABC transporter substrate-binding protein n=1 Tax=Microvirga zambiensis TaxID=1402137 RepID=UPI00191EE5A1|nr:ABC transporter substrate-binding protein [Microvirga zambiensis]
MRRRDIILLLGSLSLLPPLTGAAPASDRVRRIGWIEGLRTPPYNWADVAEHLQPLGWTRGGNVRADIHVPTHLDQVSRIAKDVVTARPDLIVTHGTPATLAVLAETRTLPIVFFGVADPVGNGIVSNLTRPGGNVTGFTTFEPSLAGKWVQFLKELDPQIRRVAILLNPEATQNRSSPFVREFEAVAASLQIVPILADARDFSGVEPVVAALASEPHGALVVLPDEFNLGYESKIIDVANRHRIPAIYGTQYATAIGGLIAYGPTEGYSQALAVYIDRILRGAQPRDLPVQAPTSYTLAINLLTARWLGLSIPSAVLAAADKVVE